MRNDDLPARRPGFQVAPSLFNAVKFELAVLLVWAALVFLALEFITPNLAIQFIVLGLFAVAAMLWLILRTRRVLRRWQTSATERN